MIIYQVDSFTSEAFKGNPAGVCITQKPLDKSRMQQLANEMNLSETAFVSPGKNETEWQISYFTPTTEVPMCGHATLASAHIMYENAIVGAKDTITFLAAGGTLQVVKEQQKIIMNYPAYPIKRAAIPTSLESIIDYSPVDFYESSYDWKIVLLEDETQVLAVQSKPELLIKSKLGHLMVTAPSNEGGIDYVVRVFAPASGIDEDPVTGSAQCALTPFWHARTGKENFFSVQLSQRRGQLFTKFLNERVEISGEAKTIFKIEVLV